MQSYCRLLLPMLLSGMCATAQVQPPPLAIQINSVQVSAQGKYDAEPDTALLTLTLSDKQPTQEAAYKNVSNAAEQFRSILRQNSVDPKQARVSNFNVNPEIDWRSAKHNIIGYTVQTTASLKLRDFSLAGKLLTQLSQLTLAGNQNLSYELEDMEAAKQKAISDAYKNAHASAETIAQVSQHRLGDLVYASVDTQSQFIVRPMMEAGAAKMMQNAPAPTEGLGQQTVTITANVNAVFRLQ